MTQNAVSRLMVIGNGFDLKCDLKSKFEDYYNSKVDKVDMVKILNKMNEEFNEGNTSTEILQADVLHIAGFQRFFGNLNDIIKINFNDKKISFWDFYFYFHKEKLSNWADVEYFLSKLLTINSHDSDPELNFEKSLDIIVRLKCLNTHGSSDLKELKSLKDNFTKNKETLTLLFILLNNLKYNIEKHSERYFYDFLFDELNKFEKSFKNYLITLQDENIKKRVNNY